MSEYVIHKIVVHSTVHNSKNIVCNWENSNNLSTKTVDRLCITMENRHSINDFTNLEQNMDKFPHNEELGDISFIIGNISQFKASYQAAILKEVSFMKSWIVEFLSSYEYVGLFILTMLEPLMPIISIEEMIHMTQHPMFQMTLHPVIILLVIVTGSVIGALLLYSLGLLIGIRNMEVFFETYAKGLPFTYEQYEHFLQGFEKHSPWLLFFSRFIPIVRGVVCIPAGMVQMHIGKFIGVTTLGSFLWSSALLAQAGLFEWRPSIILLGEQILVGGVLLLSIVIVWSIIKRRRST